MSVDDHAVPRKAPTLAGLEARLELLEQGKPKTWQEKFTRNGALIALVLSITTGAYTIYDNFWAKPRARIVAQNDADLREVQRGLAEIAAINQSLGSMVTTNAAARLSITGAASARKRAQLSLIMPLLSKGGVVLDASDYISLSDEIAWTGDTARARALTSAALQHATNDGDRINALSRLGAADFSLGEQAKGREAFKEAARLAASNYFAPIRATLHSWWATAEARNGNCAALPPLLAEFQTAVDAIENVDVRDAAIQQLRFSMKEQRGCPWKDTMVRVAAP